MSNSHACQILQDLIRCPSVTPQEGGALSYLQNLLESAGFSVERPVFEDADTPDVENLFASIGSGAPHFVFAGHTDVVPPGDEQAWSHGPFAGDIEDGMMYGRGTVDMKGGIACFAAAALTFLQDTPQFTGTISFLITGDEEGPAINGTVKLLHWCKERGIAFDHCIVGEPTNPNALGDAIKIGRRGSLSGVLTVNGVQGHVAYPHLSDNPIRGITGMLEALMVPALDAGNERFQPTNLEWTSVDVGNATTNITPASAYARFNVRFNDQWTPASLEAELRQRLDQAVNANKYRPGDKAAISYDLEIKRDASESFLTHSETLISALSNSIAQITGRTPELSTGGGTSDARFIKNYCPVVEFGLVGKTMHQVDEQVSVADLDQLAKIYHAFLRKYFS
ncbi:MAG: succinyl-diaminopimelate desuccinylase [Rhizobiales bacterium]|nr:succinyl-diaminopimelate desuccinylase [Hyphomicrobiales bacterium]